MYSLVFDLETSSKHPVGQILNYAFVLFDYQFKEVSRCHGSLKLSPLELPEPGAILANRVDVKQLMQSDAPSERLGLKRVHEYLTSVASDAARAKVPVAMLGYNSFRFDIPYLRTSLIRSGLNPYFGKWIVNRDLLQAVRWLACTNDRFPRLANASDPNKLSLRLETLSQYYGLLSGVQSHESLEDVLLTARLIQELHDNSLGVDVRLFNSYQPTREHEQAGRVVYQLIPNYDLTLPYRAEQRPMMFLCASSSGALWVDLFRFMECRSRAAVRWFSKSTGSFFLSDGVDQRLLFVSDESANAVENGVLAEVQECCSGINLDNYFTTSACDIEQDIYRLDFDARDALNRAIWFCDRSRLDDLKNKDASSLAVRAYLKELDWSLPDKELPLGLLQRYASYRYGVPLPDSATTPRLLLPRVVDSAKEEGEGESQFHPALLNMKKGLYRQLKVASGEDEQLLRSLAWWYEASPIGRLVKVDETMENL